jgi:uncharacterized protein (DUF952 family)
MRMTYHLVPDGEWAAADPAGPYAAGSLAAEGFIHCTDGADALVATANRHYRDDPRPFLALTIDLDAAGSPWTVDDPAGIYPHVHGPIERSAITAVARMARTPDGVFIGLRTLEQGPGSVSG